ncbi:hypothetical protein PMIT1312_00408 [Prochlorococcus marinus str. MIT 1312]|nr:hypothetical protein PMIT1312_00408 [Prochlorococcus marinus str. MIT 1312]
MNSRKHMSLAYAHQNKKNLFWFIVATLNYTKQKSYLKEFNLGKTKSLQKQSKQKVPL